MSEFMKDRKEIIKEDVATAQREFLMDEKKKSKKKTLIVLLLLLLLLVAGVGVAVFVFDVFGPDDTGVAELETSIDVDDITVKVGTSDTTTDLSSTNIINNDEIFFTATINNSSSNVSVLVKSVITYKIIELDNTEIVWQEGKNDIYKDDFVSDADETIVLDKGVLTFYHNEIIAKETTKEVSNSIQLWDLQEYQGARIEFTMTTYVVEANKDSVNAAWENVDSTWLNKIFE